MGMWQRWSELWSSTALHCRAPKIVTQALGPLLTQVQTRAWLRVAASEQTPGSICAHPDHACDNLQQMLAGVAQHTSTKTTAALAYVPSCALTQSVVTAVLMQLRSRQS